MYRGKKVAVVVPAYNEELLIGRVIETMPDFVDLTVVVNDCSPDKTGEIVQNYESMEKYKVKLLDLEKNEGVGGAIAAGYKYARDHGFDCAAVMAGDAQMNPDDLPALLDPVVDGIADYSKGNRLITGEAFKKIPKVRYFGNAGLSLLTKIASGYWHVADSQTGYTVINKKGLHVIDWDQMYKRYGQPNDLLVTCNIENLRVCDVPVEPVYGVGEKSGINIKKVIFKLSFLLTRLFFKRMAQKYVVRDFHPLVLFYGVGALMSLVSLPFLVKFLYEYFFFGVAPTISLLLVMFNQLMALQLIMFAMWFDMESNKALCVKIPAKDIY